MCSSHTDGRRSLAPVSTPPVLQSDYRVRAYVRVVGGGAGAGGEGRREKGAREGEGGNVLRNKARHRLSSRECRGTYTLHRWPCIRIVACETLSRNSTLKRVRLGVGRHATLISVFH